MERISEKLEREKQELDKLYKKRDRIIETIRAKESKVQDYENQLRLEKYNSADHVLSMNGLSLDDLLFAIQNNDLSTIQSLMNENKENA